MIAFTLAFPRPYSVFVLGLLRCSVGDKHAPLSDGGDAAAQEWAQLLHQLLRAEGVDAATAIHACLPLLLLFLLLLDSCVPFRFASARQKRGTSPAICRAAVATMSLQTVVHGRIDSFTRFQGFRLFPVLSGPLQCSTAMSGGGTGFRSRRRRRGHT